MATRADWVDWYKAYCLAEFDVEEEVTDEQTEFPVMFSTFEYYNWETGEDEEEEHEIQLTYFTDTFDCVVYVDNVEVYRQHFDRGYDDLVEDVRWVTFDSFYEWAHDQAEIVRNRKEN